MIYVGIDVAKDKHDCTIIDDKIDAIKIAKMLKDGYGFKPVVF